MFHHEFIVDNYTVWVRGDVSKLEAFASICPVPADQFMVSAFVMNLPGATPLDCKELDKLPRPPLAQSRLCVAQWGLCLTPRPFKLPGVAMLMHSSSGMSMLCLQQCCKPWTASN